MRQCIMIISILGVQKDCLGVFNAVTGYVLRETESGAPVDAVGYIGSVAAYGRCKVLHRKVRIGEQSLFAHGGGDLMHQFVGLFGGSSVLFVRFLGSNGLHGQGSMCGYISDAEQQYGHQHSRDIHPLTAVKQFASEHVQQGRDDSGDTEEHQERVGRLEQVTAVVGIGVIHALLGSVQQSESADPDPNNLNGEKEPVECVKGFFRQPFIVRVDREENGHEDGRHKEQEVIPCVFRARQGAEIHVIKRIYGQVGKEVGVSG